MDLTKVYDGEEISYAYAKAILKEVYNILKKRGYNPINQIVGYLMSGDLGYITSYMDARAKISSVDRSKLIEVLVMEVENF
jgi:uncharacterized protein (UPF0297 family)